MNGRDEILHLLRRYDRYLLGCHLHPDGDAIGSLLALGLALETAGKQVAMVLPGGVPGIFRFLEGTEKILPAPSFTSEVIIALDCADRERLLLPEEVFAAIQWSILIYHQPMFGDYNYVFPSGHHRQINLTLDRQRFIRQKDSGGHLHRRSHGYRVFPLLQHQWPGLYHCGRSGGLLWDFPSPHR